MKLQLANEEPMNITRCGDDDRYAEQTEIIARALTAPDHSINELLRLMRQTGQPAVYLSGTRLDNDFCFGSGDIGILLSVLPQDTHAFIPGYHPGSAEIYVTFQGSLVMECLENGKVTERNVRRNQVLVVPPGQCHRVRGDRKSEAASLIVKTSLSANPSVVRCEDCTYYQDKTACPLYQSWSSEVGQSLG